MADNAFWEDLLEFIDDRRVIPVVGADLLRVEQDGHSVPLQVLIARRLAGRLNLSAEDLPEDDALNAVIHRHLGAGGRREEIYPRLRSALKESPLPLPPALRKLASIGHFPLFVTTTFDSLLEQALNEVRFGGDARAQSIVYVPNDVQDLQVPMKELERRPPAVFHLFGRLSAAPDYALTEEDLLEFVCALQSEERRPRQLFQELKNNHLLLIGNRFPDWLARFFIRLAKGGRLSGPRDSSEILADRLAGRDKNLVLFLRDFSYRTQVYQGGDPEDFVNELAERYRARHPPEPGQDESEVGGPSKPKGTSADVARPGSVFLSYSREDFGAVEQLAAALEAVGVDVWFDRKQLQGGDEYAIKIRRNIKSCALFIPVISRSTQRRMEAFFRREWKWAAERSQDFAEGIPFILPVCIDDTPEADAMVPDLFLDVHWSRLAAGKTTPEFGQRMVRLIREYRKRQRGSA